MGLTPMNEFEMMEVQGGDWKSWLKGGIYAAAAKEIIDHWDELKKGFVDGWKALK